MDTRMIEAFERQPAGLGPIAAVRAAMREAIASFGPDDWAGIRETTELTLTLPEVRARAVDEFGRTIQLIAEAIAKRAGRAPGDLAIRTLAGAIIGVIMSVTMPWDGWAGEHRTEDAFEQIDAALAQLEAGLPL
jgi:hypothetical protein